MSGRDPGYGSTAMMLIEAARTPGTIARVCPTLAASSRLPRRCTIRGCERVAQRGLEFRRIDA